MLWLSQSVCHKSNWHETLHLTYNPDRCWGMLVQVFSYCPGLILATATPEQSETAPMRSRRTHFSGKQKDGKESFASYVEIKPRRVYPERFWMRSTFISLKEMGEINTHADYILMQVYNHPWINTQLIPLHCTPCTKLTWLRLLHYPFVYFVRRTAVNSPSLSDWSAALLLLSAWVMETPPSTPGFLCHWLPLPSPCSPSALGSAVWRLLWKSLLPSTPRLAVGAVGGLRQTPCICEKSGFLQINTHGRLPASWAAVPKLAF